MGRKMFLTINAVVGFWNVLRKRRSMSEEIQDRVTSFNRKKGANFCNCVQRHEETAITSILESKASNWSLKMMMKFFLSVIESPSTTGYYSISCINKNWCLCDHKKYTFPEAWIHGNRCWDFHRCFRSKRFVFFYYWQKFVELNLNN